MANQIATQEFRDPLRFASDRSSSKNALQGHIAMYGIGKWGSVHHFNGNAQSIQSSANDFREPQPPVAPDYVPGFQPTPPSSTTDRNLDANTPVKSSFDNPTPPGTTSRVGDWPGKPSSPYREAWNRLDRLAFALAKVDLATWEHTRIKDRISQSRSEELAETKDAINYFTTRLRMSLHNLGMTRRRINGILDMCQSQEPQHGMRIPVEYEQPSTAIDKRLLHDLRIRWRESKACSSQTTFLEIN